MAAVAVQSEPWPAHLSRTATGRSLAIHSVGLPYVRAALEQPWAGALAARWRACLGLLGALELARRLLARRRAASAELAEKTSDAEEALQSGKEAAGESPLDPAAGNEAQEAMVPPPLPSWPELLSDEQGRIAGLRGPLAASVALSVLHAVVLIKKGKSMAGIFAAQNSGNRAKWIGSVSWYLATVLLNVAVSTGSSYFRAVLGVRWRETLTRKLHDLYFQRKLYYKLLTDQGALGIPDADFRIVTAVGTVCETYSSLSLSLLDTFVKLAIMCLEMATRVNVWSTLAAPLFCLITFPPLVRLSTLDTETLMLPEQRASAALNKSLTRVQLHSERICMMQGEHYEHAVIESRLQERTATHHKVNDALVPFKLLHTPIASQNWPNAIVTFGNFLGSYVIAWKLRRPQGIAATGPLDMHAPRPDVTQTWAELYETFMATINLVITFVHPTTVFSEIQRSNGAARQVLQLFASLRKMRELSERSTQDTFLTAEGLISFDDVTVATPTGQVLLGHLSFEVPQGERLMICGHNGAGKSSIIRCLSALWSIQHGKIARPHGATQVEEDAQQLSEVYYLPQKPCNVIGSLSDQLTYPERLPGGLPPSELRRWLRYVGLEYVLDREAAQTPSAAGANKERERDWEAVLSLGEQQALSIARLLYHRPRFAILDECTSAVSRKLERALFEMTREIGTSCITITHRPALKEHHGLMLHLTGTVAQDGRGWEFTRLPHRDQLAPVPTRAEDAEETHRRLEAYLKRGGQHKGLAAESGVRDARQTGSMTPAGEDADIGPDASEAVYKRWPSSLHRFFAVLRLALGEPGVARKVGGLSASMLLSLCLQQRIGYELWRTHISANAHSLVGDVTGITAELFVNGVWVVVAGLLEFVYVHTMSLIGLELKHAGMKALFRRGLLTGAFHMVMQPPAHSDIPCIEGPMQRIGEFSATVDSLGRLWGTVPPAIATFLYWAGTFFGGGGVMAAVSLPLFLAAFRATLSLAPDFGAISARRAELESRFESAHARFRHNAEPVAFTSGGAAERELIEPKFREICSFRRKSLRSEFLYQCARSLFGEYGNLPLLTQRMIGLNFVRRNTPHLGSADGIAPSALLTNYMYDRSTNSAQAAMQQVSDLIPAWMGVDGNFVRLLELAVAFDAAEKYALEAKGGETGQGEGIVVQGLDLVAPSGTLLAKGVSFSVAKGEPLLVTGPNGCGKSLLGAVLLGLWPSSGPDTTIYISGRIPKAPLDVFMPAPQRIYLPPGTLGDQVLYPQKHTSCADEDTMARSLELAGIGHILVREAQGWKAERVWEDTLSGGEQQRLCLARIFFRKPRFALLDECTSMVAAAAEEGLYRTAIQELGITPVTVSQRLFLPGLHRRELRLTPDEATNKGWLLVDLDGAAL